MRFTRTRWWARWTELNLFLREPWVFNVKIKKPDLTYRAFWFFGGERGIRTLGGSFPPHSLSRRAPSANSAISPINGGGSRIRTHGAVTLNGFQDRRFRPLSHPSGQIKLMIIILRIAGQYFCYCWLTWFIFYDFRRNIRFLSCKFCAFCVKNF